MSDPIHWVAVIHEDGVPQPGTDIRLDDPDQVLNFIGSGLQQSGFAPEAAVKQIEEAIAKAESEGKTSSMQMLGMEMNLEDVVVLRPMPGSDSYGHPKNPSVVITPVYAEEDVSKEALTADELLWAQELAQP